jgi:hypothetical protein
MNPPRKRKMIEFIYDSEILSPERIPNRGNKINGRSEVTAKGIASVIHQTVISNAIAAIIETFGFAGSRLANNNTDVNNINPIIKPDFFRTDIT